MRIILGISAVLLLSYTSMFQKITVPNERTRVYLATALVDDCSLSIDGPIRRFGRTADVARIKGRSYADKAPGASLAAAALYGAVRIFTPAEAWSVESLIAMMRFCLMIPVGILGLIILRRRLFLLKATPLSTDIASLGWILGTSAFHYSTAFYGHQIAAVSMMLAVHLLLTNAPCDVVKHPSWKTALAGAAAGFAGLTEYQSVIPCIFLGLFVIWTRRRRPAQILVFVLGALPFAALLLAYHRLAFGGFFELPYEHLAAKSVQALHAKGIAGVSLPKPEAVFGSMLSLHRGLITTSPVFLLVPFGIFFMFRKGMTPLAVLIGGMFVYYLFFIFGADAWYAGWSFGPRLLVPIMGLSMIPVAFALDAALLQKRPFLLAVSRGAVAAGILYHQLVHVVFPEPPETAKNPVFDIVVPALERGVLSPNRAADISGHPGLWTLIIPALVSAVVLSIILFRGLGQATALKSKLKSAAVSLGVIGILAAAVFIAGPSWRPEKSSKFVNWMVRLENSE